MPRLPRIPLKISALSVRPKLTDSSSLSRPGCLRRRRSGVVSWRLGSFCRLTHRFPQTLPADAEAIYLGKMTRHPLVCHRIPYSSGLVPPPLDGKDLPNSQRPRCKGPPLIARSKCTAPSDHPPHRGSSLSSRQFHIEDGSSTDSLSIPSTNTSLR